MVATISADLSRLCGPFKGLLITHFDLEYARNHLRAENLAGLDGDKTSDPNPAGIT
jgi:hypothetical protein